MSKTDIVVDLFDEFRPGNRSFFNLFEDWRWERLMEEMTDPDNEKTMSELLAEMLEV